MNPSKHQKRSHEQINAEYLFQQNRTAFPETCCVQNPEIITCTFIVQHIYTRQTSLLYTYIQGLTHSHERALVPTLTITNTLTRTVT